jgi:uncharacterized membrane protein YdfJ with MMPL/SSD domain
MTRMVVTVLVIWLALSVPVAVFVAALGRSALREDEAQGHLPAVPPERSASQVAEPVDHALSAPVQTPASSARGHG